MIVTRCPFSKDIQTAEIVTGLKAAIDERLDVYDLGETDRVPINELKMSGHRCTTGCIGAYFEGIPSDGNILQFSSDTGHYKSYNSK